MENPVKPSFSVPVENTLNFRSVCQNKADLHLAQCLPKALQSILFLPLTITHLNHETRPERQCEGHFFRGEEKNNESHSSHVVDPTGNEIFARFPFSNIRTRKRIRTILFPILQSI